MQKCKCSISFPVAPTGKPPVLCLLCGGEITGTPARREIEDTRNTKSFIVSRALPFSLYWTLAARAKTKVSILAIEGIMINYLYAEDRAILESRPETSNVNFLFQVDDYSSYKAAAEVVDLVIALVIQVLKEDKEETDILHIPSNVLYCSFECLLEVERAVRSNQYRAVGSLEFNTKHDENVLSGNHWGALCPVCEMEYHNY